MEAFGVEASPYARLTVHRNLPLKHAGKLDPIPYTGGPLEEEIGDYYGGGRYSVRLLDRMPGRGPSLHWRGSTEVNVPGEPKAAEKAERRSPEPTDAIGVAVLQKLDELTSRRADDAQERMLSTLRELAEMAKGQQVELAKQQRELAEQQVKLLVGRIESAQHAVATTPAAPTLADQLGSAKQTLEALKELRELAGEAEKDEHPVLSQVLPRLLQLGEMFAGHVIQQQMRKSQAPQPKTEGAKSAPKTEGAAGPVSLGPPPQKTAPARTKGKARPARAKASAPNQDPKPPTPPKRKQVRGRVRGR